MIKNCIIYKYSNKFKNTWEVDKDIIDECTLDKCLLNAQSFSKKNITALIELARDEMISMEKETQKQYEFKVSCEFKVPKLVASGVSPFVPTAFKTWLRKDSSIVTTFDAGRKLSGVGTALLSYATTGDPSSIEQIKLAKKTFLRLKDWILSNETGHIKRINMHNIKKDEVDFKQIVLGAKQLESSFLFNELLNEASAIADLSFATPPLESTSRQLICKVNYWGGLTIYTPNLLPSEISELIQVFENLIMIDE